MITIDNHNDQIENVFAMNAIPTRVLFPDPQSGEPVEVVFPMGKEYEVGKVVRLAWQELGRFMPPPASFLPRTILYHLAAEVFGPISIGTDSFISTNVTNLQKPRVRKTTQTEDSWRSLAPQVGGRKWKADVYTYDVDLVFVASKAFVFEELRNRALAATRQFNACTRFLKIGQVRNAVSSTKLVSQSALRWSVIQAKEPESRSL